MAWVVFIVAIAKKSREEGERNCFLNIGKLIPDILFEPLYKLPLLLQSFLQT
jgi:hypothetical protein